MEGWSYCHGDHRPLSFLLRRPVCFQFDFKGDWICWVALTDLDNLSASWPAWLPTSMPPLLFILFYIFLLLLPVSHYDVPQQGLLGELILIQQQIQQHEEEVRRAAATNSARPPSPESTPSASPSPPQLNRKVKVPPNLALSRPTIGP